MAFSDESHTSDKSRFMVIGGILLRTGDAHLFSSRIAEIRKDFPTFKESLHWKSLSKAKMNLYKAVIDEFLAWRADRRVDFNCIVFERSKINHRKHNESDPEKGFFKFLYQHHLCHSRFWRYGPEVTFRCYHGNMETGYDIAELKRCLNGGAPKKGLRVFKPYKIVDFMPVKKTNCLQISDILIGATGYVLNGKVESSPDSYRTAMAKYVQANCPVPTLAGDTDWPDFGFSIWNFPLGA